MRVMSPLVVACLCLTACTEPWQLDVESGEDRLVITGAVGTLPDTYAVYITRTQPYFSDSDWNGAAGAGVFLNGAPLREDSLRAGRYLTGSGFSVHPGDTCMLEVRLDADGDGAREYYAATAVTPEVVPVQSLSLVPLTEASSAKALPASLLVAFNDPVGPHYYGAHLYITTCQDSSGVYVTRRYSDTPAYYVTNMFSATVEDGSLIVYPVYMLGRHLTFSSGDSITLYPYDTLTVELNTHSEDYFRFVSQTQAALSGSNPLFMSPAGEFSGNVSGGALGAFGAYGASRAKVSVPYTPDTWTDDEMRRRFGARWKERFETER